MNTKNEYTIKDIADILQIDKQKISRYIKKNKIKNIKTDSQTFIYDEVTKDKIIKYFQNKSKKPVLEPVQNPLQNNTNFETENKILIEKNKNLNQIIDILKNEINELKKDKENHQMIIDRLTILLNNEQKNKKLSSPKEDNENKKTKNEKGFWQRLFNI